MTQPDRPGTEYRPTHDRGEPLPIDLDGIEMRWASQWNESDDGEARAWRGDVAELIGEVHRLRRVSNAYFEEMVRRTPNSPVAALPTSPAPSLDVERLARAIRTVNESIRDLPYGLTDAAAEVAAEYRSTS